jgi:biopolymer transport protein TolR
MRRARKSINQINVVPYIDVMLVLLVIFMVTAPLITPGEIELPSVGSKLPTPVAPMQITLNADKSLSLSDGSNAPAVRVSRDELVARLLDRQAKNPDQAIVIAAKGTTQYKDVIDIVDLLQRHQVQKVGLLARQQPN